MRGNTKRDWVYDFEVGRENEPIRQHLSDDKVAVCVSMRDIVVNESLNIADRRAALAKLLEVKSDKTIGQLGNVKDADLAAIARLTCPMSDEFFRNLIGKVCNYPVDGMSVQDAIKHVADGKPVPKD